MRNVEKFENVAKRMAATGMIADFAVVTKNGVEKASIVCGPNKRVQMRIYVDIMLNDTEDEIFEKVMRIYENEMLNYQDMQAQDTASFINWEKVKDKIHFKLLPKREEILETRVTTEYLDLVKVYDITITENSSVVVSKRLFDEWNISVEELDAVAMTNTERDLPVLSANISTIIHDIAQDGELSEADEEMFSQQLIPMDVLTNAKKMHGAAVILYPSVQTALKRLAKAKDTDLYILPSSIHELILITASDAEPLDPQELKETIHAVNDTEVAEEDLLSYSLYKYDKDLQKVVIAN